jgi:hypothetical protein
VKQELLNTVQKMFKLRDYKEAINTIVRLFRKLAKSTSLVLSSSLSSEDVAIINQAIVEARQIY